MDGDEIAEWKAHFNRHPWTQDILDYAQAQICCVVARAMGDNKKAKVSDFLLINRKRKRTAKEEADSLLCGC